MHTVACSRCERRGRYRLDSAAAPAPRLVSELTADCPQRESAALMERCAMLFPG